MIFLFAQEQILLKMSEGPPIFIHKAQTYLIAASTGSWRLRSYDLWVLLVMTWLYLILVLSIEKWRASKYSNDQASSHTSQLVTTSSDPGNKLGCRSVTGFNANDRSKNTEVTDVCDSVDLKPVKSIWSNPDLRRNSALLGYLNRNQGHSIPSNCPICLALHVSHLYANLINWGLSFLFIFLCPSHCNSYHKHSLVSVSCACQGFQTKHTTQNYPAQSCLHASACSAQRPIIIHSVIELAVRHFFDKVLETGYYFEVKHEWKSRLRTIRQRTCTTATTYPCVAGTVVSISRCINNNYVETVIELVNSRSENLTNLDTTL